MKAYIINIGDEILIGETINTNASWMAYSLDHSGVEVKKIIVIGDDKKAIISSLEESLNEADLVLITGGLGPTHDDITKHTLCEYFNDELVFNEKVYSDIVSLLKKHGKEINELNRTQAFVPKGCKVMPNKKGTAPGMMFNKNGRIIISMPGVPHEMKSMMSDSVLPIIKQRKDAGYSLHRHIHTFGLAEANMAEILMPVLKELNGGVKLAFLPSPGHVKLRLTSKGNDLQHLENLLKNEERKILEYIGEYIYGYEKDKLEEVIGGLLVKFKKSLVTAESCTGGMLASRITSVSGSSKYFLGSVIAYSNNMKEEILSVPNQLLEKHGAVSEEVVSAMAEGARKRFGADYSLATSGIAGPDGGTVEKPVGTIWIAMSSSQGIIAKKLNLGFDRNTNIRLTSDYCLDLLRKELNKSFHK